MSQVTADGRLSPPLSPPPKGPQGQRPMTQGGTALRPLQPPRIDSHPSDSRHLPVMVCPVSASPLGSPAHPDSPEGGPSAGSGGSELPTLPRQIPLSIRSSSGVNPRPLTFRSLS